MASADLTIRSATQQDESEVVVSCLDLAQEGGMAAGVRRRHGVGFGAWFGPRGSGKENEGKDGDGEVDFHRRRE